MLRDVVAAAQQQQQEGSAEGTGNKRQRQDGEE